MNTSMTLLTLSHQYGSGGSLIARELGHRLNWKVWDKEIVRTIASQQHVSEDYIETKDERVGSFIERVVESFGVGGFESAYNIPPPLRLKDSQLARLTRTLIENVAREGRAIIVGRGGNCILAGRPKTLHVFVFASLKARIERVMNVEGLTTDEAKRRITGMDKLRTDYVHKCYQTDWRDADGYHLQLDSSVWGEAGTATFILQALERHSAPA